MSQDKALEGSNPRDELKAINAAIAAHIATADAINPVGGAAVRHSDEDQTSGQVKKTRRAGCFVFKTRLRWAVRRSTLRWWIISTTPRGRFHLAQHQGKKDSVQLEHRLGGLEAAAFALWWLEEGSNTGLHFDQAFVEFTVLLFFNVFSSSEL